MSLEYESRQGNLTADDQIIMTGRNNGRSDLSSSHHHMHQGGSLDHSLLVTTEYLDQQDLSELPTEPSPDPGEGIRHNLLV